MAEGGERALSAPVRALRACHFPVHHLPDAGLLLAAGERALRLLCRLLLRDGAVLRSEVPVLRALGSPAVKVTDHFAAAADGLRTGVSSYRSAVVMRRADRGLRPALEAVA